MKSDKNQSLFLIGVALLFAGGALGYIALSQPRVYDEPATAAVSKIRTAEPSASQAETTSSVTKNTAAPSASAEETASDAPVVSVSFPLNLNTATVEELMQIDGLGPAKASAIVEYRAVRGGYTSVEQIMEIKGIGEGIYQQVAPYLTV